MSITTRFVVYRPSQLAEQGYIYVLVGVRIPPFKIYVRMLSSYYLLI